MAIKKVNFNNYTLIAAKVLSFSLLVYFYWSNSLNVENALLVYLLELMVMVLVLIPFLSGQDKMAWTPSWSQFKESFLYGFKVYQAALISFLVIRSDVFLIKYFLDFEQVGYYGTAVQITDQVSVVAATIAGILMPRLTMIKDIKEKKYRTKQVLRGILLMMLVIILPLILFADKIIFILFGEEFMPSVPSLRILLAATSFLSLLTILIQFLASEGFPRIIVKVWFVALLLNVILNFVFIPRWGIEGAAISSFISYLLVLLTMFRFINKRYTDKLAS